MCDRGAGREWHLQGAGVVQGYCALNWGIMSGDDFLNQASAPLGCVCMCASVCVCEVAGMRHVALWVWFSDAPLPGQHCRGQCLRLCRGPLGPCGAWGSNLGCTA